MGHLKKVETSQECHITKATGPLEQVLGGVTQMTSIDDDELEILRGCETGALRSVAIKSELAKFKAAARATAIKDGRVSIRLSSGDLSDIPVKALEEGVPYQMLT